MCVSVGACVYEAGAVEVRGVRTTGAGDACEPPGRCETKVCKNSICS